jgi:hypothetical protein
MGLFREPVHSACHASHEKGFRRFLAAVPIRSCYQFLGFWYG